VYDLTAFTLRDMTVCGAALRDLGRDVLSRGIASAIVCR